MCVNVTSNNVNLTMPMIKSQILKTLDLTETQKSRYLQNETLFFFKYKNSLFIKGYFIARNSFAAEVTFNHYCNSLLVFQFN